MKRKKTGLILLLLVLMISGCRKREENTVVPMESWEMTPIPTPTPRPTLEPIAAYVEEIYKRYQEVTEREGFVFTIEDEIWKPNDGLHSSYDIYVTGREEKETWGLGYISIFYDEEKNRVKKSLYTHLNADVYTEETRKDFITATFMVLDKGMSREQAEKNMKKLMKWYKKKEKKYIVCGDYRIYLNEYDSTLKAAYKGEYNVPVDKSEYKKMSYQKMMKEERMKGVCVSGRITEADYYDEYYQTMFVFVDKNNKEYYVEFDYDQFATDFLDELNKPCTIYARVQEEYYNRPLLRLDYYETEE